MRLPSWLEWGYYGGPDYGDGNWYVDERGAYQYNQGVEPQDGLDAIYEAHDKAYGLTELKLERGDITQTDAIIEKMHADGQLIWDSTFYNPNNDPLVPDMPDNKKQEAALYRDAAIIIFTGKMLMDADVLVAMGASDAIIAAGAIIADLIASGADVWGGLLGNLLNDRLNRIKDLVGDASRTKSPIVLDLNNDGIVTTGVKGGAYFDHDSSGFAELTGWVKSDDGLLVMDRNGNGYIDDGTELFGNHTILSNGKKAANGFAALAELDDNQDGKIDASDAAYSQLKIWRDIDGDGWVTYDEDENGQVITNELFTLSELGIQSIDTGYTNANITDANGNIIKQTGTFTWADGSTGSTADVWFKTDNMYTIAKEWLDISEDIAALPFLFGFGNVYNLHQAMVRDESGQLKVLVEQFAAETDASVRHTLVIQILYHWTGVQDVDPLSRASSRIYGNAIGDARKLATLEAFIGEPYAGTWCWNERDPNPHGPAAKKLLQAFDLLGTYNKAFLKLD